MKLTLPEWLRRRAPRTIHTKFLLSMIVASFIAMFVYSAIRVGIQSQKYDVELRAKLDTMTHLATMTFSNPVWHFNEPGIRLTGRSYLADREIGSVEVVSNHGELLFNESKAGVAYEPQYMVKKSEDIFSEEGENIGIVTLSMTNYYYQIGMRQEALVFAFSMLLVLGIQSLLITIVSLSITRPLVELTKGTRAIAEGDTEQKLVIESMDEIGELSQSFNRMSENLTIMINQRNEAALALENANLDLESKVSARTLELKDVNEKLQNTNNEVVYANECLKSEMEVRIETEARLSSLNIRLQETLQSLVDTQKQLVRSEKLSALTQLISGVAHEINTPIGVCITANTYLEKICIELKALMNTGGVSEGHYVDFVDESTEITDMIKRNLETAIQLINSLKMMTGIERQKLFQTFYVGECIKDTIAGAYNGVNKDIKVSLNCSDDIVLNGKAEVLSHIMNALLSNSLIHGFECKSVGEIQIHVENKLEGIEITYQDNGVGIPKAHLEKVFDPFFTTARGKGNTGLGLFVVYEMLTLHFDGAVICESSINEGVRFTLVFPRMKQAELIEEVN